MEELMSVLSMQGYGSYVWGSVLLTLSILVGNFWYAHFQLYKKQKEVREGNS